MKVVQIKRFIHSGETNGLLQANKFLAGLNRDDVIDVKLSTGNDYTVILIVYAEEKDEVEKVLDEMHGEVW